MDVFRTDRIRNVVLLGHSGSGKTSLTEAMAYLSGMTNRLGKVTDGNTVSDFDKEEIKRTEWKWELRRPGNSARNTIFRV